MADETVPEDAEKTSAGGEGAAGEPAKGRNPSRARTFLLPVGCIGLLILAIVGVIGAGVFQAKRNLEPGPTEPAPISETTGGGGAVTVANASESSPSAPATLSTDAAADTAVAQPVSDTMAAPGASAAPGNEQKETAAAAPVQVAGKARASAGGDKKPCYVKRVWCRGCAEDGGDTWVEVHDFRFGARCD